MIGSTRQILPRNIYRWDPSGRLDVLVPEEPGLPPNGICFSPDYKLVYLVRGGQLWVGDVQGAKIANLRVYTDCMVDGVHCGPDGMRCRSRRQYLGRLDVHSGLFRCHGLEPGRQAARTHPAAGSVSQSLLCRPKAGLAFMCGTQSIYLLRVNIQGAVAGLMGGKRHTQAGSPARHWLVWRAPASSRWAAPGFARPARRIDRFLREKINHVVVIYAENRSFNNLFSNFPGLAHPLSAVAPERLVQRDRDGICPERLPPIWGGLVPRTDAGWGDASDRAGCDQRTSNGPFALRTADGGLLPHGLVTRDLVHAFYHNQMQINGGRNDGFVAWGDSGALVMGHYGDTAAEMKIAALAREFALCDNFFMGAFGGSFLNHQYLVAAQPPFYPNADTSPASHLIATLEGDDPKGHAAETIAGDAGKRHGRAAEIRAQRAQPRIFGR